MVIGMHKRSSLKSSNHRELHGAMFCSKTEHQKWCVSYRDVFGLGARKSHLLGACNTCDLRDSAAGKRMIRENWIQNATFTLQSCQSADCSCSESSTSTCTCVMSLAGGEVASKSRIIRFFVNLPRRQRLFRCQFSNASSRFAQEHHVNVPGLARNQVAPNADSYLLSFVLHSYRHPKTHFFLRTLLKSAFVHNKARVQYEVRTHFRLFKVSPRLLYARVTLDASYVYVSSEGKIY